MEFLKISFICLLLLVSLQTTVKVNVVVIKNVVKYLLLS